MAANRDGVRQGAAGQSETDHPFLRSFRLREEPFYIASGDEVQIAEAAYADRIPLLLKGPTGCGKTRFVEYLSWRLGTRPAGTSGRAEPLPLVTVTCHEDLTASDLVGRFLLKAEGTEWMDGPLTMAVRNGGICYLDEIVEARKDTTVVIHSLSDYRRRLAVEKLGVVLDAHDTFFLVVSYNPGYQSSLKDLKHSTRQRFISLSFTYPDEELETEIIRHEAGVDEPTARALARVGSTLRNLDTGSLLEGPSTRLLIHCGRLIARGLPPPRAAEGALIQSVSDDLILQQAMREVVHAVLG